MALHVVRPLRMVRGEGGQRTDGAGEQQPADKHAGAWAAPDDRVSRHACTRAQRINLVHEQIGLSTVGASTPLSRAVVDHRAELALEKPRGDAGLGGEAAERLAAIGDEAPVGVELGARGDGVAGGEERVALEVAALESSEARSDSGIQTRSIAGRARGRPAPMQRRSQSDPTPPRPAARDPKKEIGPGEAGRREGRDKAVGDRGRVLSHWTAPFRGRRSVSRGTSSMAPGESTRLRTS